MSFSCVFCQIVEGKTPVRIVYKDSEVVAFEDINQQAPVHILLVPKKHTRSVRELSSSRAYQEAIDEGTHRASSIPLRGGWVMGSVASLS